MNDLGGYDSVPEPRIVIAALNACRRLNDYALAVRFLEMVKYKCGPKLNEIYPYIVQVLFAKLASLLYWLFKWQMSDGHPTNTQYYSFYLFQAILTRKESKYPSQITHSHQIGGN